MKIFKLLFLVISLWGLSACTKDFEEINTNPNAPTVDKAAPDQLLTNAVESMTNRVHEIFLGHEMGECWVQHMAKVQYTDEDRYIYRTGVVNNTWSSFYAANGKDADLIYQLGVARGHENYQGVALVLKAYIMSVLTDLHGDVPYTQAFQGDLGVLQPTYDTQESIYRDIIDKLDDANTLLDPAGEEIAGDILFENDIDMWKKFANSLRLRLLLRMSSRDAAFVTTEMTKMVVTNAADYPLFERTGAYGYDPANPGSVASLAAVGNPGEDASLHYLGSSPNNNPVNENRKTRDDHRMSENFIDLLLSTYGDWRVFIFAKPSGGTNEFVGIPNGLTSAAAAAFNGGGLPNTSKISDYFTEATSPGQLITYSELQFILSEATKRGYITGAPHTAQVYYEEGVVANFEQYREFLQQMFDDHPNYGGQGNPAGYTVDDELNWALTGGAPWDDTYQLIAEQRYIAMFGQGLQSWFEWRRTGFPVLTPAAAGANGGKIPVRVPYPLDEALRNPTSMAAAIAAQGTDDLNTRVWWDTTP